jgi:enoyl-CoA hydratase/carnithine racemase
MRRGVFRSRRAQKASSFAVMTGKFARRWCLTSQAPNPVQGDSMSKYSSIRYQVDEQIATITLYRPQQLNAFTTDMMNELLDVFDIIDRDDGVRAVIVTGEGRAFCAGADLSAGAATFDAQSHPDAPFRSDGTADYSRESARDGGGRVTLRIFGCLKPIIAAINGAAVGVGATMTLPMDIRLAADTARIGFVFSRRGIVPEAASSFFLPRIVGISQALEWCFSGRVFPASEAVSGGLLKAVYSQSDLLPAAGAIAREIADNTSAVSIALIRQMMWRGLGYSHPMEAHRLDSRGLLARGRSADVAEGVSSFLQKRPAQFPDRISTNMPDYYPWWEEPTFQ